jgi:cytochrome P450
MSITPSSVLNEVMEMRRFTEQKVQGRVANRSNRPDIIGQLLKSEKGPTAESMSRKEMEVNAMMLVAAGSELVTTVLNGLLNYLLRNPDYLVEVKGEIQAAFSSGDMIVGSKLKQLPILNSTLNEGMRL